MRLQQGMSMLVAFFLVPCCLKAPNDQNGMHSNSYSFANTFKMTGAERSITLKGESFSERAFRYSHYKPPLSAAFTLHRAADKYKCCFQAPVRATWNTTIGRLPTACRCTTQQEVQNEALGARKQSAANHAVHLQHEVKERSSRMAKLKRIKSLGVEPYPSNAPRMNATIEEIVTKYNRLSTATAFEEIWYTLNGRIRSLRNNGMFMDIEAASQKIQVYCDKSTKVDALQEEQSKSELAQSLIRSLDVGDFISATGYIRKTHRGEITLHCKALRLLGKALLPLPDKVKGLKDLETRYRQRQMDLLVNKEVKTVFLQRSKLLFLIRQYMEKKGFVEVETPILNGAASGATARPFVSYHDSLKSNLFLRISPELHLKRLIVGALSDKLFEISRCFRNEGVSTWHNPEFTILEAYESYGDYRVAMRSTETLIQEAARCLKGGQDIEYRDATLSIGSPWRQRSMLSLITDYTEVNFLDLSAAQALTAAKRLNVNVTDIVEPSWGDIVEKVFDEKVRKWLVQPIHVTHLPTEISPLAKASKNDPRLAERFESYIYGKEIANGYSELNDPNEQRERFLSLLKKTEDAGEHASQLDHEFLIALEQGLPPTCGFGVGIDRLAMILTNSTSIRDVILFPVLRGF